jgi:hypothetical protein
MYTYSLNGKVATALIKHCLTKTNGREGGLSFRVSFTSELCATTFTSVPIYSHSGASYIPASYLRVSILDPVGEHSDRVLLVSLDSQKQILS